MQDKEHFLVNSVTHNISKKLSDKVMKLNETTKKIMQMPEVKKYLEIIRDFDIETYHHSINVTFLVSKMLPFVYRDALYGREKEIQHILIGSLLHDIGKITIPKEVLLKKEKLNKRDLAYIHQHPLNGADIVRKESFSPMVEEIILKHHEKLDGTGYPCGYMEQEISKEVRIVTAADILSALTEKRCYKPPYKLDEALEIMDEELKQNIIDGVIFEALKQYVHSNYEGSFFMI